MGPGSASSGIAGRESSDATSDFGPSTATPAGVAEKDPISDCRSDDCSPLLIKPARGWTKLMSRLVARMGVVEYVRLECRSLVSAFDFFFGQAVVQNSSCEFNWLPVDSSLTQPTRS